MSEPINVPFVAGQRKTGIIWNSDSAPNAMEITNIVRSICLHIHMLDKVKGCHKISQKIFSNTGYGND